MAEIALIGSLISAAGSIAQGVAANNAAGGEAAQLTAQGNEELAAAQREALSARKEGELVASAATARAASGGGGAYGDIGIENILSGIALGSEFNAQTALYGGKSRKAGLLDAAAATKRSGQAALIGSVFDAAGTVAGGAYKYRSDKGLI